MSLEVKRGGPLSFEEASRRGAFQNLIEALRAEVRTLDANTAGLGGRYEYADIEDHALKAEAIAFIARQMSDADAGKITWMDARDNVWAEGYAPTEQSEAEARGRVAARKRTTDWFNVAKDICAPPADRLIPLASMDQVGTLGDEAA